MANSERSDVSTRALIELVWLPVFTLVLSLVCKKASRPFSTLQTFNRDFQVTSREANTMSLQYTSAKINCIVSTF